MKTGFPSKTALSVAIRRAEHQLFDFPHVLEDPIAPWIIGPKAAASIMFGCLTAYFPISRYMRAFIAARSRYAEDQLARAIASGTAQYVILGAGLDTFPYRNPYSKCGLRVFEVDHPDTQAWKRRRLALTAIPVPSPVTFVPVDFEHQRLEIELERAGFRLGEPAFFSWLGVTPYLTNEAAMATLTLIHSLCPENAIAFDYALPRQTLSEGEKMAFDAISKRVVRADEPFRGFFRPEVLVNDLKEIGFRRVESPTTDLINALYFRNRLDGLRVRGSLGALMCAY
jgi:methyltransferase (TIGR00027 family)